MPDGLMGNLAVMVQNQVKRVRFCVGTAQHRKMTGHEKVAASATIWGSMAKFRDKLLLLAEQRDAPSVAAL